MSEAIALGRVPEVSRHEVSLQQAAQVWLRVALLSFGGPAGQIAVMHRILVEEKAWISEERFLHAHNYCMLLPGPEAQQLATYIGWLMHRTIGGIVAGGLFVVPGIVAIMALSYVYAGYGNLPVIAALFFGLKAAVFAIVLEAVLRIGKRAPRPGPWSGLRASPSSRSSFSPFPSPSSFSARPSSASLPGCRTAAHPRAAARTFPRAGKASRQSSIACSTTNCPSECARPSPAASACPLSGSPFGSFR
jgi:chromate transport protein ChrA